jgi:multiple antibiotic resistance protein
MTILSIAFTLFLIMNSLGMTPAILVLLKNYDEKKQRKIILREMVIALIIIFVFNYLGEVFFQWLQVGETTIQMAGGLILFLIAVNMIFPRSRRTDAPEENIDPFIVPIATPLIAGPSLLATVMFYAHEEPSLLKMLAAIMIAWAASTIVLLSAPFLKKIIGDKGLNAFERLMGLILTLIAVQMFLEGLSGFLSSSLPPPKT